MKKMMIALLVALCAVVFLSGCDFHKIHISSSLWEDIQAQGSEEIKLENEIPDTALWASVDTAVKSLTDSLEENQDYLIQLRVDTTEGAEVHANSLSTRLLDDQDVMAGYYSRGIVYSAVKEIKKGGKNPRKISAIIVTVEAKAGAPVSVIDQENDGKFDFIVNDTPMVFWPDAPYKGVIADVNGKRLDDSSNWGDNLKPIHESGKTFSEMTERRE